METSEFKIGLNLLVECAKRCKCLELRKVIDWANTTNGILVEFTLAQTMHINRLKKEGIISDLVYYTFVKDLPEEADLNLMKINPTQLTLHYMQRNLHKELEELNMKWESGEIQKNELKNVALKARDLLRKIKSENKVIETIKRQKEISGNEKETVIKMIEFMTEYLSDILSIAGIE